jgi:hypothetical protein
MHWTSGGGGGGGVGGKEAPKRMERVYRNTLFQHGHAC